MLLDAYLDLKGSHSYRPSFHLQISTMPAQKEHERRQSKPAAQRMTQSVKKEKIPASAFAEPSEPSQIAAGDKSKPKDQLNNEQRRTHRRL